MTRDELLKIKLQIKLVDCYYKYENSCIDIETAQSLLNECSESENHFVSGLFATLCIRGNEVKKDYYSKKRIRLQNKLDKLSVK